jgi:hypothetical protein
MPGFRLKSSVVLDLHAGGAQLRDKENDRVMVLSRTEGLLLSALGRDMSTEDIVHRVEGHTTPLDYAAVMALFMRLAAAGFLEVESSATPVPQQPTPPPPGEERVPCIRNDLVFAPGKRLGVVEVKDPRRNRSFTLYDFEANIARMLDGRRTLAEVAEAADRLGIETSPEALRNFFRQLEAFGFLSDEVVPVQPPRGRKPWLPEIREMYRHALRHSRRGELGQAVEYLEALLQVDPDVPEARDLLLQVRARQNGAAGPDLDFQRLHGGRRKAAPEPEPAPPPNPFRRFDEGAAKVEPTPPLRSTRHSPSPPPIAPTLAPPPACENPLPVSPSLPPLWTVSTVVGAMPLPEVGDSILAFDPRAAFEARPPEPRTEKPDHAKAVNHELDVPWDRAANE